MHLAPKGNYNTTENVHKFQNSNTRTIEAFEKKKEK